MTALKDTSQSQQAEEAGKEARNLGAEKLSRASIYAVGQKAERELVQAGGAVRAVRRCAG